MNRREVELRAASLVTFTITRGLLVLLSKKGLVEPEEMDLFLEGLLSALEGSVPPVDPASRPARELLEEIVHEVRESLPR